MSDEPQPTDLMQQRAFDLLQAHARSASADTEMAIRVFYDQSAAHAAALTQAQHLQDIVPTLRQKKPSFREALWFWLDVRWVRLTETQRTWKLVAALPVVLLCVFLLQLLLASPDGREAPLKEAPPPVAYTTKWRETREIALSDGSGAWLDWQTSIRESSDDTTRRVTVDRGKVVFNVVSDPARPFVVQAGAVTTEVTGTEFTVNFLTDADVEVAVMEGQVRVATEGAVSTTLYASEVVLARGTELGEVSSRSSDDMLRWREGLLVYRERSLSNVLNELAAYTPYTLDLTRIDTENARVSGAFYKDQAEDALFTVLESQKLAFTQVSNRLIIEDRPDV
ncbi:MAG: FecR domain-containing protein [Pseudomonadota bacterium]